MIRISFLPFLCSALLLTQTGASGKEMPSPYPAPEPGVRLTPPESPAPVLNEPRLFGARPAPPSSRHLLPAGNAP